MTMTELIVFLMPLAFMLGAQILGTGYQRACDQSRISVNNGAQFLNWASWSVDIHGNDIETINFGSYVAAPATWTIGQSFEEGILGAIGAGVRFGGLWDAHQSATFDPPGLFPRDDLANVGFVVNRTDTTQYVFPFMRVRTVNIKSDNVKLGAVGFDVSQAMNQGPFQLSVVSV